MINKQLNTAELFLILNYNLDEHTEFKPVDSILYFGLTGAVILDLELEAKVKLTDRGIQILDKNTNLSRGHQLVLSNLSKRDGSVRKMIKRQIRLGKQLKQLLISDLKEKELVGPTIKRAFLFKKERSRLIQNEIQVGILEKLTTYLKSEDFSAKRAEPILKILASLGYHQSLINDQMSFDLIFNRLKEVCSSDLVSRNIVNLTRKYKLGNQILISPA